MADLNPETIIQKLMALPRDRKVSLLPDRMRARMVCQWHEVEGGGREKTASFFINIVSNGKFRAGTGHCFGCGKNIGSFRQILDPTAEGTDVEVEDDADTYVQRIHSALTDQLLYGSDTPVYDLRAAMEWNPAESWRGIPGQLMTGIGAQMIFEPDFQILMAYLPVLVQGEHVGGIRARLKKKEKAPSYYNVKGPWVAQQGLFPFDYTLKLIKKRRLRTVVLVEGPRDALRCLMFGIPAMAILGTGNWTEAKSEFLHNIGIARVILAFDPDNAGLKATKAVYESLGGELDVKRFDFSKFQAFEEKARGHALTEAMDPGNMSMALAQKLKGAAYQNQQRILA